MRLLAECKFSNSVILFSLKPQVLHRLHDCVRDVISVKVLLLTGHIILHLNTQIKTPGFNIINGNE